MHQIHGYGSRDTQTAQREVQTLHYAIICESFFKPKSLVAHAEKARLSMSQPEAA